MRIDSGGAVVDELDILVKSVSLLHNVKVEIQVPIPSLPCTIHGQRNDEVRTSMSTYDDRAAARSRSGHCVLSYSQTVSPRGHKQ